MFAVFKAIRAVVLVGVVIQEEARTIRATPRERSSPRVAVFGAAVIGTSFLLASLSGGVGNYGYRPSVERRALGSVTPTIPR